MPHSTKMESRSWTEGGWINLYNQVMTKIKPVFVPDMRVDGGGKV